MKVTLIALIGLLIAVTPGLANDDASPHHMMKADGQADLDKCGACHEADMSLSRTKRETCTLCHAETLHSGAYQHLHASPESVQRLLTATASEKPILPLAEDGGIYCGTCHIFHDPHSTEERFLSTRRTPPSTGLAHAVEQSLAAQWESIARKYNAAAPGAQFSVHATQALRLQVDDGTLCRHCHGSGGR